MARSFYYLIKMAPLTTKSIALQLRCGESPPFQLFNEKEYKADCYESGENGEEEFNCLIIGLREDIIRPEELKDYGMDYD